jgi:putative PIN family toxin of toxin-antitoxin system
MWKDGKITLCLSNAILDEYIDVLRRIGLKDEQELEELPALFSKGFNILFTTKTPELKIVRNDPDDNKFVEAAVALKAGAIISGDKELVAAKGYMGIEIVTPQKFLETFRG